MANNKTLSERIVDSAGTGKSDPAELDVLTGGELGVLDGATAGTAVASKAVVLDANKGVSGVRDTSSTPVFVQAAPATVNATATMTAANLLLGLITSTTAAAVSATLPLASAVETALLLLYPGLQVNDSFDFTIINTGGTNALTVLTNTGWTLVGDMTVAPLAVGDASQGVFRARRTAANTYTLYRVG